MDSWNTFAVEAPRPIVSHEVGQWCAYPDFSEIPKYTGLLRARNFEIFQESLTAHHMGDRARDFLAASGKLQILCYKEEIEALLRTRNFGGFQVPQANDFPGQGTALAGWLNAFWESKGYVTPEEFRRFNAPTVPLIRLPRRVFSSADTLRVAVEIAHFGPVPLEAVAWWKLSDADGRVVAQDEFAPQTLPVGNGISLGKIHLALDGLRAPGKFILAVGLADTEISNAWDIWICPAAPRLALPRGIFVARSEAELRNKPRQARRVLYLPPPGPAASRVALGFSSIFWNTAWSKKTGSAHAGPALRPRASALCGISHGISFQLAMVGADP